MTVLLCGETGEADGARTELQWTVLPLRCWQGRCCRCGAGKDGAAAAVLASRADGGWTVLLCWEGIRAKTAVRGGRGGG